MERTGPESVLNVSRELAAVECLEMLDGEREISHELIAESERLLSEVVRALETGAPLGGRARCRLHLTALRAFVGGGFHLDTKES